MTCPCDYNVVGIIIIITSSRRHRYLHMTSFRTLLLLHRKIAAVLVHTTSDRCAAPRLCPTRRASSPATATSETTSSSSPSHEDVCVRSLRLRTKTSSSSQEDVCVFERRRLRLRKKTSASSNEDVFARRRRRLRAPRGVAAFVSARRVLVIHTSLIIIIHTIIITSHFSRLPPAIGNELFDPLFHF